jgi:hypothetical protein
MARRLARTRTAPDYGYNGQVQRQFNITRGFSDPNHRDSVFNVHQGRDDAMIFGEHLGEPPAYGPYIDSGMRLVDNDLRSQFNNRLGNPSSGLQGYDWAGVGGFAANVGVTHAQSHDSDYAARKELQHAFYFLRDGLGLLYTDGNYQAETLGESGGAFPRHSNTSFIGQWGDGRVPNLLYVHEQFARGYQLGRFSDADVVVWERLDKRENPGMSDADAVTLLVMLSDNYSTGTARTFTSAFSDWCLFVQLLDLRRRLLQIQRGAFFDGVACGRLLPLLVEESRPERALEKPWRQADHDHAKRRRGRHGDREAQRRSEWR